MVRVLLRGMASLGLRVPEFADPLEQATVPLDLKRAVVRSAVDQGGIACLPLLGRGLHDLAMEPTHLALTTGDGARSTLLRWQRLERYIHSRHRIRILEFRDGFTVVEHFHGHHGPKPLPFEDLVVCGVLCALLEANGLDEVQASAHDATIFPEPDHEQLSRAVALQRTSRWEISWSTSGRRPSSLDLPVCWDQVSPPLWTPFARTVGGVAAGRLPELMSLEAAASEAGMSRRTLQRVLAAEKLTYRQLLAEVRFRLAGWHLLRPEMPIAEIGFVCGYSDQAHLTREFRRRVGVPPAKYRGLFAAT